MRMVKKMYLVLFLLTSGFLAYQCGGNNEKETPQDNTSQTESSSDNSIVSLKGNPVEGKTIFGQTCAACHGVDGKGLPKLGKDLTTSTFVSEKSDKDLLQFVEQGRQPSDPLNTTGVAMPPKGGNPALTDQQIIDVISYVREIHQ
ncbi:MAG TPA: cytochrome c [Ignavibacteriaceae bacterium]|nr:cytochrome c [Ignavibacteriaceae bacterium]